VHIVDSTMSGSIAVNRLSTAYSMDFSTEINRSNIYSYAKNTFEYWVEYSHFADVCRLKAALYVGKTPAIAPLRTAESTFVLLNGASKQIKFSSGGEVSVSYSSSDTSVATVSSKGVVKAVGGGSCRITCSDGTYTAYIDVYSAKYTDKQIIMLDSLDKLPLPAIEGALPNGCFATAESNGVTTVTVFSPSGSELFEITALLLNKDDPDILRIPATVKTIEANAFEGISAKYVLFPAGVETVAAKAFANSEVTFAIFESSNTVYASDSFPKGAYKVVAPHVFE